MDIQSLHTELQAILGDRAVLADAMQESRTAFRQHWYRKRAQLAELDFVRGLRDEA